jgi:hypothetical protein
MSAYTQIELALTLLIVRGVIGPLCPKIVVKPAKNGPKSRL